MDNWIEILEFNKKSKETWDYFLKLLDDEKIPYKEEIKEAWEGSARRPQYEQYVLFYVPEEYKEKVEAYLKEYNNPDNIIYEEIEELENVSSDEEDEKGEDNRRNIAEKILVLTPFIMIFIVIICGIISNIIYK